MSGIKNRQVEYKIEEGYISIARKDDFDLEKIRDSGQCFRLFNVGSGPGDRENFLLIALGKILRLSQDREKVYFECDEGDFKKLWIDYFDLETDYKSIREKICGDSDPFLYDAANFGKGIRILKQDPWETLITFIISQRKNIPAIQKAVSLISYCAGQLIGRDNEGKAIYSFPSPKEMAKMTDEDYGLCKLGYREKYVRAAVSDMLAGKRSLEALEGLENNELDLALREFYGVGKKISDCVSLFAYHRLSNCPMDVWMKKVEEEYYQGSLDLQAHHPFQGLMQQYLFYYIRRFPL